MQTVLIDRLRTEFIIDPVIDLVQVIRTFTVDYLLDREGDFVCIGELYNKINPDKMNLPLSYGKYKKLLTKDLEELAFGLQFERLGEYCRLRALGKYYYEKIK